MYSPLLYIHPTDEYTILTTITIIISSVIGSSGDGGPAIKAQLFTPSGITVDTSGNLYFADTYNYKIRSFNYLPTVTRQPTSSPTNVTTARWVSPISYPT